MTSETISVPSAVETGRVDFHTHILPRMDDGSKSPEESVQMVRTLFETGVRYVVLTPHFYAGSDNLERFLHRRDASYAMLTEAMAAAGDMAPLQFILGAEVEYFRGIAGMDDFSPFYLGKSRCLLLEMPMGRWTSHMVDDILALQNRGDCRVVLAHVERYLFDQKKETIHMLLENRVVMQSNADYFLNRRTAGRAVHCLQKGYIHLLGSDCHNMITRPPNLGSACAVIEKRAGADLVQECMAHARHLLWVDTHFHPRGTAAAQV